MLTIRELADALAAWMDAVGLARATSVGNPLGCEILVELALRHPARVERLILQGPIPEPTARIVAQQVWRYAVTGLHERSPLGWVSTSDYVLCGPRRFARTLSDMLQDRIVSQPWAEEVAGSLPDGRLMVIPSAGHAINFSYPGEFRRAILPFLLGRERSANAALRQRNVIC